MRALWQEHRAGYLESVGVIERAVRQLTEASLTSGCASSRSEPRTR
jgi:hypothetical protein